MLCRFLLHIPGLGVQGVGDLCRPCLRHTRACRMPHALWVQCAVEDGSACPACCLVGERCCCACCDLLCLSSFAASLPFHAPTTSLFGPFHPPAASCFLPAGAAAAGHAALAATDAAVQPAAVRAPRAGNFIVLHFVLFCVICFCVFPCDWVLSPICSPASRPPAPPHHCVCHNGRACGAWPFCRVAAAASCASTLCWAPPACWLTMAPSMLSMAPSTHSVVPSAPSMAPSHAGNADRGCAAVQRHHGSAAVPVYPRGE